MGGKVFQGTSPINYRNISPTIRHIESELGKRLNFKTNNPLPLLFTIGGTGRKEVSNDIDLGLDITRIQTAGDARIELFFALKELFPDVTYNKGTNVISFTEIIVGPVAHYDHPDCMSSIPRVQVDLMITDNPKWTRFVYWHPKHGQSSFSGLARNIALFNYAKYYEIDPTEIGIDEHGNPVVLSWGRHWFDLKEGMCSGEVTIKGKNGNLVKNPIVKSKESMFGTRIYDNLSFMFAMDEPTCKNMEDNLTFEEVLGYINSHENKNLMKEGIRRDFIKHGLSYTFK